MQFQVQHRETRKLKISWSLVVVLPLCGWSLTAIAQGQHDYDAVAVFYEDLQQIGDPAGNVHSAQAIAYVDGVADMTEGAEWCPNGDVSRGQEIDTVQNYMGAHRELWNLPARKLIVAGLKEGFPCHK